MNKSDNSRPRIAWLSPFPPQTSGIANYSYWLVKALKPHFKIDFYYDGEPPIVELQNEFDVYPVASLADQFGKYHEVIYHLGNNSGFHKGFYELAWAFPGTVVLHDYDLSAFLHEAFYRQNYELYRQALPNGEEERTGLQGLIHRADPRTFSHAMSARRWLAGARKS